jgi:4-hydroxybenzoate polyprenyltransferase
MNVGTTIRLLRPTQWAKNAFLFTPLVFSKHLFEIEYAKLALLAFAGFSLVSSSVYIVNDIADREADREHPLKKSRPIAEGSISVFQALIVLTFVLLGTIAVSLNLSSKFQLAVGIYFCLNLAYSFGLKRVILVDVFFIAAGFMLRVLAGAFALAVAISPWLVLCTLFVSMFLAVSKRRAELLLSSEKKDFTVRTVLREYDLDLVDQMMTIAAAGMAISYALYTVAERTVTMFGTENLIFTTVFVLFGIFRYLYLVRRRKADDNPAHLLVSDPAMIFNVIAWFMSCILIIYFNEIKNLF